MVSHQRGNEFEIRMNENIRMFVILLKKNFWIRKKLWHQSFVFQLLMSIGLTSIMFFIWDTKSGSWSTKGIYHNMTGFIPDKMNETDILNFSYKKMPNLTIRYTSQLNDSGVPDEIMNMIAKCLNLTNKPMFSSDEKRMIEELEKDTKFNNSSPIGVVFETMLTKDYPSIFKYRLRFKEIESFHLYMKIEEGIHDVSFPRWLGIQVCVDRAYINWITDTKSELTLSIQQMPYPSYYQISEEYSETIHTSEILLLLIFSFAFFVDSGFLVSERQSGVQILMTVNGAKNHMNLFSWIVSGAVYSLFYTIPIALLMSFPLISRKELLFQQTDTFILWLAIFTLNIQSNSFQYHLSAYFPNSFIPFIMNLLIPYIMMYIDGSTESFGMRHIQLYFGIISPNFLLSRIMGEIRTYEVQGDGVRWSNIFTSGDSRNPPEGSIGVLIILSIVGTFLNFLMTVYINAIFPGEYGVPRHPLFFLHGKKKSEEDVSLVTSKGSHVIGKGFETVPEGSFEPGLQIRRLTKTYVRGILRKTKVYALRGVSADFYKGQITALLGHNGAGKTTMMSIWSGFIDASGGATFINGKNIRLEPEVISNNVGLCPQKNLLFPNLTVFQHLMFFGGLKSKTKTTKQLKDDIEILLLQINMTEKENSLPEQLSRGQKRRLCIAIAVIGDANVLIFDEPTSGIDAESKRQVWDIILKMRGQKTIIINTHDMEEANILGDRIAIMHSGKLRSYGTSMFLKKLYGDGQVEVTLSVEPSCTSANILGKMNIAANVLSEDQGKIVLTLPMVESLPEILDKLEISKAMLGITGISVSIITLDQIFTKVTEDESKSVAFNNDDEITSSEKTTGFPYFMQTLWGYSMKKKAYLMENPWKGLVGFFLPGLAILLILIFKPSLSSIIKYSLKVYSPSIAFVKSDRYSLVEMFRKTVEDHGGETFRKSETSMQDALLTFAENDLESYNKKMIVSAEFSNRGNSIQAVGFHSGSAVRGIPIVINCLTNTILKDLSGNKNLEIEISFENFRDIGERSDTDFFIEVCVVNLSIMFFVRAVSLYALHPQEESDSGMKHLQCMTGASKISYWLSMFSFDMLQYIFSVLSFFVSFIILDISRDFQFFHMIEMGILMILFLLFGISVIPFTYLVYSLKLPKLVNSIILLYIPIYLLYVYYDANETEQVHSNHKIPSVIYFIYKHIIELIPHEIFLHGFVFFLFSTWQIAPVTSSSSYFGDNPRGMFLGHSMMQLAALSFLHLFLLFIFESRIFNKIFAMTRQNNANECSVDIDNSVGSQKITVQEEVNKHVNSFAEGDNENVFSAHGVQKYYGKTHVVEGISFRVKQGECFGLLGVNGAGKSTTFRMLTGAETPDGGTMYTQNFGIHNNRTKYLAEMGYCPQHDVLIDSLNTRDHLYLFARLRGVPETEIKSVVAMWIQKLNLTVCAAQPSSTYSGGNKRKLQIAMALIGNPSLILMDEPTAGVDPCTIKSFWKIVKSCRASGQTVIFTSHSMEECEVLCNRLAIMVRGKLVCSGTAQELKQRFGTGFKIQIKLSPTESAREIEQIKYRIESSLVCKKMDENPSFLNFHVTDPKTTWTHMYATMDSLKSDYTSIEDYTVLSATFEQLLIHFAEAAEEEEAKEYYEGAPKDE